MKRIVSILLSLVMLLTMVPSAFATESATKIPGISVSRSASIGTSRDSEYEYISIIDRERGTAQAAKRDLQTGEYSYGPIVVIDSITGNGDNNIPSSSLLAMDPTSHQDTFSNYEYDIWEMGEDTEWRLERPKDAFRQYYFMTNQVSKNWNELLDYRDIVDELNDIELTLIGDVGMATLKIIVAVVTSQAATTTYGVLSPAAWESVASAVDAGITALSSFNSYCGIYNSTAQAYFDAYEVSDVFFDS